MELENIDNPIYGIRAGENTRDYIFLLSYQELIDSFICQINYDKECDLISMKQNNDDLVAFVKMENKNITEASQKYGLDYNLAQNQAIGWWLRTPGANENRCVRVNCNGAIRLHGREVDRCLVGIRPALWLEERDG